MGARPLQLIEVRVDIVVDILRFKRGQRDPRLSALRRGVGVTLDRRIPFEADRDAAVTLHRLVHPTVIRFPLRLNASVRGTRVGDHARLHNPRRIDVAGLDRVMLLPARELVIDAAGDTVEHPIVIDAGSPLPLLRLPPRPGNVDHHHTLPVAQSRTI